MIGQARITINIVTHGRWDVTRKCLASLFENTTEPCLIQVLDNASRDETWAGLTKLADLHDNLRIYRRAQNTGFPGRQNELADLAMTPYICVLNNDVEVGKGWQEPLIAALERDPGVAQAGTSGQRIPIDRGTGLPGRAEYLEGWCFVVPRWVHERFGMFAPEYKFAYYEDTDLSLRLQEAGYKIATVGSAVHHAGSQTRRVCLLDVDGYEARNRAVFLGRWGPYLKRRNFRYRVKLIRPAAHGDVLMMTPAIRALRRRWPRAYIAVETRCPEMLLHHPDVDAVIPEGCQWAGDWDFVWDLTKASEMRSTISPARAFCEAIGVTPDSLRPDFWPHPWDQRRVLPLLPGGPFVALHVGKSWATKTWPLERFKTLALCIQEQLGLRVVEVGAGDSPRLWVGQDYRGRLSWSELGAFLEHASAFVGIDSGPAHVAQAVGTPSVVLFGPTSPSLLLHPGARVRAVRVERLRCLGCYHVHPPGSVVAECARGDLACQRELKVDRVLHALKEVLSDG